VRHTVRPRGDVARLSVAVIVDDERATAPGRDGATAVSSRPRDVAQMQKIQELVAAAVGLDPARGDQVTVQNIAFDEAPVEPLQPAGLVERFGPTAFEVGRIAAVLAVGLLALLFIGRPLMVRALQPIPAGAGSQLPRTIEDIEGELEAQLAAGGQIGDRRTPVLTKRLTGLAQKEPESAARLVRAWLVEDRK